MKVQYITVYWYKNGNKHVTWKKDNICHDTYFKKGKADYCGCAFEHVSRKQHQKIEPNNKVIMNTKNEALLDSTVETILYFDDDNHVVVDERITFSIRYTRTNTYSKYFYNGKPVRYMGSLGRSGFRDNWYHLFYNKQGIHNGAKHGTLKMCVPKHLIKIVR